MLKVIVVTFLLLNLLAAEIVSFDDGSRHKIMNDRVVNLDTGAETVWKMVKPNCWKDQNGNTWTAISEQVFVYNKKYVYVCNDESENVMDYVYTLKDSDLENMRDSL
jgi:hypothetical protein